MRNDCLFCGIADGDIPSTQVHADDLVVAFRDIAPRAPVHVLVIPREHLASAAVLTEGDATLLGRIFAVAADVARERGDRRRRLPDHDEHRQPRRPDRAPPAFPRHGRPSVHVAAGLRHPRGSGRARRAVAARCRSSAGLALAGCGIGAPQRLGGRSAAASRDTAAAR